LRFGFLIFAPGFSLKKARNKSENPARHSTLRRMLGCSVGAPLPIDFIMLQMISPPEMLMAKTWKLNPAEKFALFDPDGPRTFPLRSNFLTTNRRARKE